MFYKDLFITFSGQIIVMILAFVLNKIMSNMFSVSEFGVYNLIRRFISVVSFVMLMSLGIAIPKFIAEANAKNNKDLIEKYTISAVILFLIMSILVSIPLIFFRDFFSKIIFNDVNYSKYMFPVVLFSFGSCISSFAFSFYRGINNFFRYSLINISVQLILIFCLIFKIKSLYYLYIIWGFLLFLYGFVENIRIFKRFDFTFKKMNEYSNTLLELFKYSFPRIPGEFILFAYNLVPLSIIGYKFGHNHVGYFSAALSINSLITPLFSLVGAILLPFVSASNISQDTKEVNSKIKTLGIIYIFVSIVAISSIYLFGKYLIIIFLSSKYLPSIKILELTTLSILPNSIYLLLRNPIDAKSHFPYNTICLFISFLFYVSMLWVSNGIIQCAYSMIFSYTILGILSLIIWKKIS